MATIYLYLQSHGVTAEAIDVDILGDLDDIPHWRRKLFGDDQSMPMTVNGVEYWCIARALEEVEDEAELWLTAINQYPELANIFELTEDARLMRAYFAGGGVRFKRDYAMEAARQRFRE